MIGSLIKDRRYPKATVSGDLGQDGVQQANLSRIDWREVEATSVQYFKTNQESKAFNSRVIKLFAFKKESRSTVKVTLEAEKEVTRTLIDIMKPWNALNEDLQLQIAKAKPKGKVWIAIETKEVTGTKCKIQTDRHKALEGSAGLSLGPISTALTGLPPPLESEASKGKEEGDSELKVHREPMVYMVRYQKIRLQTNRGTVNAQPSKPPAQSLIINQSGNLWSNGSGDETGYERGRNDSCVDAQLDDSFSESDDEDCCFDVLYSDMTSA